MCQDTEIQEKKHIVSMYKMLENDLLTIQEYIYFHPDNLKTYSFRLYNLLFLSCNIFEICAKRIDGKTKSDMNTWKINDKITRRHTSELNLIQMDYKFKPLEKLGEDNPKKRVLNWWKAYNNVKHGLHNINDANLENVIHASGAAGILIYDYCSGVGHSAERSKLFREIFIPTYY